MTTKLLVAIFLLCPGVLVAQQPATASTQGASRSSNPPAAPAAKKTPPVKVRVDRTGWDRDPKIKPSNGTEIGAGTRGGPASNLVLYAPNLGVTYALLPVFYWEPPPGTSKLIFRLYDSNDDELYETEVTGQRRFSYPQDAPTLKAGATYYWVVQAPGQLSGSPDPLGLQVLAGAERQDVQQELQKSAGDAMQQQLQRAQVFVDHLLWYDAIAAYSQLISDYPGKPDLYRARAKIYAALPPTQKLAQQDLAHAADTLAGSGATHP